MILRQRGARAIKKRDIARQYSRMHFGKCLSVRLLKLRLQRTTLLQARKVENEGQTGFFKIVKVEIFTRTERYWATRKRIHLIKTGKLKRMLRL